MSYYYKDYGYTADSDGNEQFAGEIRITDSNEARVTDNGETRVLE